MKLKSEMKYNEGGMRKYDYDKKKLTILPPTKKHILI